jgi:hypothetical protein
MVDEQLTTEQEEWEVVNSPNKHEETSGVPKAVADSL